MEIAERCSFNSYQTFANLLAALAVQLLGHMSKAISNLLRYVEVDEVVPTKLMLESLQEAVDGAFQLRRRQVANELMKDAGDYLPSAYLAPFIRAELADTDVRKLISDRKKYVERASNLFPGILRLVGAENFASVRSALHLVDDYCHDFPIVAASAHFKKKKREIVQGVLKLRDAIKGLTEAMEEANRYVEIEYEHHKSALLRSATRESLQDVDQLKSEIDDFLFAAEVVIYKQEVGLEPFYVGDNKARTHVVECAYCLSLWFGTPQFVTTPGSDFGLLCSLIFELATGITNESLAGAINKFARSELRKRLDDDEAKTREENSDEAKLAREADNFSHVTEQLVRLAEEYTFWQRMVSSGQLSELVASRVALRASDVLQQMEEARQEYGPHLIWVSQVSRRDQEQQWLEIEERDARLLKLEIQVGELRRASRRN